VLAEDPRFGWSFPYDIWPACRRNERDGALEDPFQAIMRVGVERKIWKDGVEGFGDTIGELAARMVGWDFQNQYFHLKEIRRLERDTGTGLQPGHRPGAGAGSALVPAPFAGPQTVWREHRLA